MTIRWPRRPLAEVAPLTRRPIHVDAGATYREIGIRSFAKGVFHKPPVTGLELGDKRVFAIKPGDLLFNIVFAWEGAVAVASAAEEGTIGSHRFLTCLPNPEIADANFLFWWFSRGAGREQLLRASPGGAGRNRTLGVDKLAAIEVPLPPVSEQRRIVAQIQFLATRLSEAKALRLDAEAEASVLWSGGASELLDRAFSNDPKERLGDLLAAVRGGGTPSKSQPRYWEGPIPWITPKDMKKRELSDSLLHISEDAVRESPAKLIDPGAVLVVVRGMILAHTFPSAVLRRPAAVNQDMKALIPCARLLPEFLCSVLWSRNSKLVGLVERSSHDTRKFNLDKLLGFELAVPPIPQQQRIIAELDALQAQVKALTKLQTDSAAELNALLPAVLDDIFHGQSEASIAA
jgi:type I restriction enzyme S subunit